MTDAVRIGGDGGLAVEASSETLETALSLSAATTRAFSWEGAGFRDFDSLAIRFFAGICGARTSGGAVGERTLDFAPGPVRAGAYRLEVGGSEPVLRVLRSAAVPLGLGLESSEVAAAGSTHAPHGETFEVASSTWAHLMRRIGYRVELQLERAGFAPRGGGELRLRIEGRSERLAELDLRRRGKLEALQILSSASSLPTHVQQRQAARARSGVQFAGIDAVVQLLKLRGEGSGSAVAITGVFEGLPLTVASIAERGKSGEAVGEAAAREFRRLALDARGVLPPVLLPSLLLASAFAEKTSHLTSYALPPFLESHAELVRVFAGREVRVEGEPGGPGSVVIQERA